MNSTDLKRYRAALRWILDNEDTGWIDNDQHEAPSRTAIFTAEVFDLSLIKVVDDLKRMKARR